MPKSDLLPDQEIQDLLKAVFDDVDKEDRAVRDRQIRLWRRMKLYWDGFQRVWYSEVAHDWRIFDDTQADTENHQDYYDKPINVFRAYLETIIAALSVTVPPVKCTPDDPDNPLDDTTAKGGTAISKLIFQHNKVELLWVHALFTYCTEGMVACYNSTKADPKYGTYPENEYKDFEEDHYMCPECRAEVDELYPDTPEYDADVDEMTCPECGAFTDPKAEPETITITRLVGVTDAPKSRQDLKVRGGLYVKVPNYAARQEDMPYLIYSEEYHFSILLEEYPDLADGPDWKGKIGYNAGGVYDPYERWGRLNPQYHGEYPLNTVTKRMVWLRPCAFNILQPEEAEKLKKKYPTGCLIVMANEEFCEVREEALDDHWTLTKNPLSDYIQHDPLGLLLTSIQDITNELTSLTLQTIEHGIPQTFADPAVVNFDQYGQTEATPGTIYAAVPAAGKSLSEAFHEVQTATLSREVLPFGQKIQEMGQLVVGALPSLFGGAAKSGSNTAAEYQMSRAQALQRLQTPWKMLTVWWEEIFGKVIPAYIRTVEEDQRFVDKDLNGNYINVFVRKAELQGKIGSVELEANETLPMSHTQKRDVFIQLMEMQNVPAVMEALASPEILPFIKETLGLDEFVIPGEADRLKQYEEIKLLVQSEPIVEPMGVDPMTGQPIEQELPSIQVEPDVDDHKIQADICRSWLISEAGQLVREENLLGYTNVLLHMKAHILIVTEMQQQEMMQEAGLPTAAGGSPSPEIAAQVGEPSGIG